MTLSNLSESWKFRIYIHLGRSVGGLGTSQDLRLASAVRAILWSTLPLTVEFATTLGSQCQNWVGVETEQRQFN